MSLMKIGSFTGIITVQSLKYLNGGPRSNDYFPELSYKMEEIEQILDNDSFEGIYLVSFGVPDKLGEGFYNKFNHLGDLEIFPRGFGKIRYIECD